MTMTRLFIPTPELRNGDVVSEYGMRCLIDCEPRVYEAPDYSGHALSGPRGRASTTVYAFGTEVLNAGQVLAGQLVPASFIPANRWTIQGNDLAYWTVDRETEVAELDEEAARFVAAVSDPTGQDRTNARPDACDADYDFLRPAHCDICERDGDRDDCAHRTEPCERCGTAWSRDQMFWVDGDLIGDCCDPLEEERR